MKTNLRLTCNGIKRRNDSCVTILYFDNNNKLIEKKVFNRSTQRSLPMNESIKEIEISFHILKTKSILNRLYFQLSESNRTLSTGVYFDFVIM